MNLKNLAQLYNVNIINIKNKQTGGSSNNFIKWLFAQETETETESQTVVQSPVVIDSLLPTPVNPLVPSNPDVSDQSVPISPAVSEPTTPAVSEPTTPFSVDGDKNKYLMVIYVGLPKCGKTQMSIQILNMLKINKLKTKFVETPVEIDEFTTRKYYDNIKKQVDNKVNVIICNGNNFEEKIRKTVTEIGKNNNYNILFVEFKHSDDVDGSFDKYKEFCTETIQFRTDAVALNTNLTKAVSEYTKLSQQEQDDNNYMKVYINHNKQKNINDIVLKVKEILTI